MNWIYGRSLMVAMSMTVVSGISLASQSPENCHKYNQGCHAITTGNGHICDDLFFKCLRADKEGDPWPPYIDCDSILPVCQQVTNNDPECERMDSRCVTPIPDVP